MFIIFTSSLCVVLKCLFVHIPACQDVIVYSRVTIHCIRVCVCVCLKQWNTQLCICKSCDIVHAHLTEPKRKEQKQVARETRVSDRCRATAQGSGEWWVMTGFRVGNDSLGSGVKSRGMCLTPWKRGRLTRAWTDECETLTSVEGCIQVKVKQRSTNGRLCLFPLQSIKFLSSSSLARDIKSNFRRPAYTPDLWHHK